MYSPPILPMLPVLVEPPRFTDQLLYQVKWDGVRIMADKQQQETKLWNRKGYPRTRLYPEIVAEIQQLPASDVCLDGEMISLSSAGKPDFHRVLKRDLANQPKLQIPVVYVVFDCLRVNGKWIVNEPIERRLEKLVGLIPNTGLLQATPTYDDGESLFERMKALQMEGVVGKHRNSHYIPGKSDLWQKFKYWKTLDCTALYVKLRDGRPASLVVAVAADETQTPIGSVSTGLSAQDWKSVLERMPIEASTNGMSPLSPGSTQLQIRYLELTGDGRLRAPVVLSIEFR